MKVKTYIPALLCALALCSCSNKDKAVEFGLDCKEFEIGAEGGKRNISISAEDSWTATASEPWITVSPANGRGSIDCQILVDSALTNNPRQGIVRIQTQNTRDNREITVNQKGFDYAITVKDPEVSVENFANYEERHFDVMVTSNVDFSVQVPESAESWLKYEKPNMTFDRGIRPRQVKVRFNWGINSQPNERIAAVTFKPTSEVELAKQDGLKVIQGAAEEIPANTRKGDSIALLAISRTLGTNASWENGEKMDSWEGVQLWEKKMPGYTPEKNGRVRYAQFQIFTTKEGVPFEVQYLTAADELVFFSNVNNFLLSLDTGDYITKLTQLKRLTISAYGLTTLSKDFTNLSNLEMLDISSNNLQKIPEILNPVNFPKLRTLYLGANIRTTIYDLSNTVKTDYGGFADEPGFPRRLLEWDALDTLRLSLNYLQGSLPDMEDWQKYTAEDIANSRDTLPQAMLGTPKVLPRTKLLSINLNRMTGNLPQWLLHHPMLNYWAPDVLIFQQEGKDKEGKSAGFDNTPVNLDYYFDFYTKKKRPDLSDETE